MVTLTLKRGLILVGKVKHLRKALSCLPADMKLTEYLRITLH